MGTGKTTEKPKADAPKRVLNMAAHKILNQNAKGKVKR